MPKTVMLLIGIYGWSVLKALEVLATGASMDQTVLKNAGVEWVFYVSAILQLTFDVASLWFLAKPSPLGLKVISVGMLTGILHNLTVMFFTWQDMPGARTAYIASRNARGLSVRPEQLDFMFTPTGLMVGMATAAVMTSILLALVYWNREYLAGGPEPIVPYGSGNIERR